MDRIGAALDRITQAGHWKIAEAIAGHARERRGALRRVDTSQIAGHGRFTGERVASDLMELADAVEQLADTLEGPKAVA
jgi:ribulose-5-phosphate 4-epimerase/fuculose-1-phosphate aldolase